MILLWLLIVRVRAVLGGLDLVWREVGARKNVILLFSLEKESRSFFLLTEQPRNVIIEMKKIVISNHLFSLVRDMRNHGTQPVQGIEDFLKIFKLNRNRIKDKSR